MLGMFSFYKSFPTPDRPKKPKTKRKKKRKEKTVSRGGKKIEGREQKLIFEGLLCAGHERKESSSAQLSWPKAQGQQCGRTLPRSRRGYRNCGLF